MSTEMKTRFKLDDTEGRLIGIDQSAAAVLEISADDATIDTQVTIINDAVIAILARAKIIYTPIQIEK